MNYRIEKLLKHIAKRYINPYVHLEPQEPMMAKIARFVACEMIEGTDVGMVIYSSQVPYISEAKDLAEMGMIPGGAHRNRDFRSDMIEIGHNVPDYLRDIFFDPQTSGGLLISVPEPDAESLINMMHEQGIEEASIIGEVVGKPKDKIILK